MSATTGFATEAIGGLELLVCEPLKAHGVPHGFTFRVRSAAEGASFGQRDRTAEDHRTLREALGIAKTSHMNQVHGRTVERLSEPDRRECDSIVTDRHSLGLIVHTADCVPLLFWASGENAVGVAHAGWRGTLARVARATVRKLREMGTSPSDIHVAMGPAIRACCFEVGDEVVEAFSESGRDMEGLAADGPRGRSHLDLIEDNRRSLRAEGIPGSQIYDSGLCTVCANDRFYSYRREGKGVGRLMGIIAPAAD